MADRGEYRSIARALLHGKDFRKLPDRARHVLLDMKILFGPAGIEIVYPEALRFELRETTGITARVLDQAITQLEGEWIRIEGNVVWIIEQLRFDPHMNVMDWKHRLSVQRHIAGMPRLQIVFDFAEHYRDWFFDKNGDFKGLPSPLQGPSEGHRSKETEKGHRSTRQMTDDKTEDKTNNKTDDVAHAHTRESDAPEPAMPPDIIDVERAADLVILSANRGLGEKFGQAFTPIPVSHGSRQFVLDWIAAGIPAALAATAVYETARNYEPNDRHRQISTMRYFDGAVREAFDRERAGNTPVRNGRTRKTPQTYDYSQPTTEFKGFTK